MRSRVIVLAIAAVVWVLDALSKHWALTALGDGHIVRIVGDVRLQLTQNSGAAFSMGTDITLVFTLLAAGVVVGILLGCTRVTRTVWLVALGGLAGGAAGNLTDRLFRPPSFAFGQVVDFIAFPNFPVFNLADSAIVVSVALMFIASLRDIPTRDLDVEAGR